MLLDIEQIYHEYLLHVKDEERELIEKMPGFFAMSGAGTCFLKQMFKDQKYEASEIDMRSVRYMRLGSLIHSDIQSAIKHATRGGSIIEIETEEGAVITEYGIRGFLDISVVDHSNKLLEVIDIKSVHSYKWKKMYGQAKSRDPNPAVTEELQVATYTISKLKTLVGYTPHMYLLHYKKEDSRIKAKQIADSFLHSALMYWTEFKEFRGENAIKDIIPGTTFNCPVYKWECNRLYCRYAQHCSSPYIK